MRQSLTGSKSNFDNSIGRGEEDMTRCSGIKLDFSNSICHSDKIAVKCDRTRP